MKRSDWLKVIGTVVGLLLTAGVPAAVHFGRKEAELVEVRARVHAAEAMIMSTRQGVDDSYHKVIDRLNDINTRLSRIEGKLGVRQE